jgi:hypothetical protein
MILAVVTAVLFFLPIPTFPPVPSPTPIPTSTPVQMQATLELPTDHIYNFLATAEGNLQSAPDDISNPGVPLLSNEDGSQVFGYAKWLLSSSTPAELFGPFGTPVLHIAAVISLVIFLAIIYFIVFVVAYILRFVISVVKTVLELIF